MVPFVMGPEATQEFFKNIAVTEEINTFFCLKIVLRKGKLEIFLQLVITK